MRAAPPGSAGTSTWVQGGKEGVGPKENQYLSTEGDSGSDRHESSATCSHSPRVAPTGTPLALTPAMGNPAATSAPARNHEKVPTSAARQPVVVGAMIMDIQARPSLRAGDIAPGTTVPGEVSHKSQVTSPQASLAVPLTGPPSTVSTTVLEQVGTVPTVSPGQCSPHASSRTQRHLAAPPW